jgi:hypothetical protein
MEQPGYIRFARWPQWAFTLFPAAALACFYGFVIRARFTLGRWPTYNHPDPKQLGFDLHHALVWFLLMALPLTGIVAVIYSITALVVTRQLSLWRALWPIVVSFGIGFAIIIADPGDFFGWFAD